MRRFELSPIDGRKSFYGKAYVIEDDNGNKTLYSYDTPIITESADGNYTRLYNGYTATTGRHINAFCGMNKDAFMKLSVKE